MKKILLGLACLAILFGLAAYSLSGPGPAESYAMLSVTSAAEGEEVTFTGMYFSLAPSASPERVEARQTPFQVRIEAEEFFALFRKLDGEADLEVNFTLMEEGETPKRGAGAAGEVCMVTKQNGRNMSATL